MVHCILLITGHDGGLKSFPCHWVVAVLAIGVDMFITLEESSSTNEDDRRMFITLERPSEASEDDVVVAKHNTPMEAAPEFSN